MRKKISAWNFMFNQSIAASFLVVEVLAALHIGFPHPLAWLLSLIAAWNAGLILIRAIGLVMIAADHLNTEAASK